MFFIRISLSLVIILFLAACPSEQTQKSEPTSLQTASQAPLPTPPDLTTGSKVFISKGCIACHAISSISEAKGVLGPKLDGIAVQAGQRVKGLNAEAYLRQAIEKPDAYLVAGYQNLMTPNLRATMTDSEYEDLIAFLLSLKP
ncbi:hypothetical protein COW36_20295 [bacterium (Candidatus Blackallbacteria) CG17_big_fil_post_rev_8_21_14_2_50_48_46]|uniref:Cytochrome c domain-containing protein n=1 Tax=bacterium (Candidatus Blackallbacteria) CG17_big_fil_post_rev_8_21_14_2_50_48_46 TaxID=2014261 RepID=A0A2M7FZB7_9BACT|nr:MAG: hypothetical protein COW64_22620 [bacterium (Candidatus Blackallbacteria) CG18_big_fil_WC_8_21_14_2_50_49_26]PIW14747.1 MAG: hypothetical protein COW36_20295 [bacterium (Candidatus Blackallbacteria) CG17_big_fil_post_rev_8_21_14_2_50_48_46]PIW50849.1 MAG: hypothetical protein COW20_01110 [bacterium (Candidatus Blackallbacteria) CG13_big_fil_rev_8_21_14_2_50_49_14]